MDTQDIEAGRDIFRAEVLDQILLGRASDLVLFALIDRLERIPPVLLTGLDLNKTDDSALRGHQIDLPQLAAVSDLKPGLSLPGKKIPGKRFAIFA